MISLWDLSESSRSRSCKSCLVASVPESSISASFIYTVLSAQFDKLHNDRCSRRATSSTAFFSLAGSRIDTGIFRSVLSFTIRQPRGQEQYAPRSIFPPELLSDPTSGSSGGEVCTPGRGTALRAPGERKSRAIWGRYMRSDRATCTGVGRPCAARPRYLEPKNSQISEPSNYYGVWAESPWPAD